jgi:hypothetical protein
MITWRARTYKQHDFIPSFTCQTKRVTPEHAGALREPQDQGSEDRRGRAVHPLLNPDAAGRDAAIRAGMITRLEEAIKDSDQLSEAKCAELRGVLSTKPGLNRFMRAVLQATVQ